MVNPGSDLHVDALNRFNTEYTTWMDDNHIPVYENLESQILVESRDAT